MKESGKGGEPKEGKLRTSQGDGAVEGLGGGDRGQQLQMRS